MKDKRFGKINIKVLVILLAVVFVALAGLYAARLVGKKRRIQSALDRGQAAFSQEDWPVAIKGLRRYLKAHPDDLAVLRQFGEALISKQPPDVTSIGSAIAAYTHIAELVPEEPEAYEKLALLYQVIGNNEKLATLAQDRLEVNPEDPNAALWMTWAQLRMGKQIEARSTLENLMKQLTDRPLGKEPYVRACLQMSELMAVWEDPNDPALETPLTWLDRAVSHAPESVEALVSRARYFFNYAEDAGLPEAECRLKAEQDLQAATGIGTNNPLLLHEMGALWLELGLLVQAEKIKARIETLPEVELQGDFFDRNSWDVLTFNFAVRLANQQGDAAEACRQSDQILGRLEGAGYRVAALPNAIYSYVLGGQPEKARVSLSEYSELLEKQESVGAMARNLPRLQALVAVAEGKPQDVIDALKPSLTLTDQPELWRMMATAYEQTNQVTDAAEALQQYVARNPQDTAALVRLAGFYVRLRNWAPARDLAAKAESLGYAGVEGRIVRLGAEMNMALDPETGVNREKLNAIRAELIDLQTQHPKEVDVRILRGTVAYHLDMPQETEKILKEAVDACEEPLRAELQLVEHYRRTERVEEAIRYARTVCDRHGESRSPWRVLATLLLAQEDYAAMRTVLQQGREAVAAEEDRADLTQRLATLEIVHGDDDQVGIDLLTALADRDPSDVQSRRLLVGLRAIQGDTETLDELIGQLHTAEGEEGIYWRFYQASRWIDSDQWESRGDEIQQMLEHCISLSPNWAAPVLLLADLYLRQGDPQQAEGVYRQGLIKNPGSTRISERLLALLERQGRYSDAEEIIQGLVSDPVFKSTWQVRMALGSGDIGRAVAELRLRIANDARDAGARIRLAQLLYQENGNAGEAFDILKEAEAIDPNSRTLTAVKASILRSEGQADAAIALLDAQVATQQSFGAYWMRGVFLGEEGLPERAEQDYRKLIEFTDQGASGYLLLGNFYAGSGHLDNSITTVEEGLAVYSNDPNDPNVIALKKSLVRHLNQRGGQGDHGRVAVILADLEKTDPEDAELLVLQAQHLIREGSLASILQAQQKLEQVIEKSPSAISAFLMVIGLAERGSDYSAAADYVQRGLKANPGNQALLLARSRIEMARGFPQMASRLALQAVEQEESAVGLELLMDSSLRSGDTRMLENAQARINAALQRDPMDEAVLLLNARLMSALGQPAEAVPALKAYCDSEAGRLSIRALVMLADLYRSAGDLDKATAATERATDINPNHQLTVYARFVLATTQKRWDDLENISADFIAAESLELGTVKNVAFILLSQNSEILSQEAIKLYRHGVALAPSSFEARHNLASALYQIGEVESSEQQYRDMLNDYPENATVLNDFAWILQERHQRYGEALKLADRGLEVEPQSLNLLDTRGTILMNVEGRLADAKRDFERIIGLTIPLASESEGTQRSKKARQIATLVKLARTCLGLKEYEPAGEYIERAQSLDQGLDVLSSEQKAAITEMLSAIEEASGGTNVSGQ